MKIKVNNDILVWARQELNLSKEVVAKRLGKDVEEIESWELGEDYPTYVQLENLAYNIYKKPLAVFLFPEVPKNIKKQEKNFRTLNNQIYKELPSSIIEMINKARVMQLNLEEIENKEFIRITDLDLDVFDENFNEKLRDVLGISIELQKKAKGYSDAFEMWRSALYNNGIYVFKNAFKDDEFSGFSLYDNKYPVVYINNSMSFSRQIFTLFHELLHILLKTNGIDKTNDEYINKLNLKNKELEIICNKFAGNFLAPKEIILEEITGKDIDDKLILNIAKKYNVSREVIYRKLLELNRITNEYYERIHDELNLENFRNSNKKNGGNYYNTQKSYLGDNYIGDVCESYYNGKINIYDVSNFLNVKIEGIPNLGITLKEGSR